MKMNCWEHLQCGREPGGAKVEEFGVCPAATDAKSNGVNSGKQAGRFCWAVARTLCGDEVQGTFAAKIVECKECDFYKTVKEEEGDGFRMFR